MIPPWDGQKRARNPFVGLKRIGLMGTRFTMQADFFPKPFHNQGMAVVVPSSEEQALIHDKLFTEIELGIIRDETRDALLAIVRG